jgi:hypothetical protein
VVARKRRVIEAVAREIADLEVLHQHVALHRERTREGAPLGPRDVERQRFLSAVAGEVVRGVGRVAALPILQERRPPVASVVALAGTLDLDHLRAQVGEELRGPGPGQHTCEVEDADTVEDSGHERGVIAIDADYRKFFPLEFR